MKNSGINWLREIPQNWELLPIKSIFNERKESNSPIITDFVLSLTNDRGVIPYDEKGDQGNKSKDNVCEYKIARPNDIVINSMNLIIGSIGISNYLGCVSPVYYMLYSSDEKRFDFKYFYYVMSTTDFQKSLYGLGNGILEIRMRIQMIKLNMVQLPVPPIEEQKRIVKYLDEKILEIDTLIQRLKDEQNQLDEYLQQVIIEKVFNGINPVEKKDSNIDYIGSIPASWDVTVLSNILTKENRPIKPEDELLVCSNSGKVIKKSESKTGLVSETENNYQGVSCGDLLIHGMDTWHGAIGISTYDGKCTGVVHVCTTSQNKQYFYYYLRALAFKKVYKLISNGVRENTSDFRSWLKMGAVLTIIPSITEQKEIADYLDKESELVQQSISLIELKINKLKEYKKALIYEYVTGKKEVV